MTVVFDIESRLGQLPDTLEKTYDEIYNQIQSQPGSGPQLATNALMWVLCSYQPLSPDDLATMLSLGSSAANGLDAGGLFKLCQNLLTLDNEHNIVRFAHLSTREFLEKRCFTITDAHSMASKLCLSYLMNQTTPTEIREIEKNKPLRFFEREPVNIYPALYWASHIQQCLDQQEGLEMSELLIDFLKSSAIHWHNVVPSVEIRYDGEVWAVDSLNFDPLHGLHLACYFGFGERISLLWNLESCDINAANGEGCTMLYIACERGFVWIVTFLLLNGANVNAQGGYYGYALQAAAGRVGNERIVGLLLENGADVNAQGGFFGNALLAAAQQVGNGKTVSRLLESGAYPTPWAVAIALHYTQQRSSVSANYDYFVSCCSNVSKAIISPFRLRFVHNIQ